VTVNRPLAGLRVFVVEDEMLVSLIVEDLLADEECIVIGPFDRVSTALEAAQTAQADVGLLDVNVNGVKVYPVAETLAKRDIPFLFLSGYGDSAIPANRPDWVACRKPFRADDLMRMLAQCVKSARRPNPPAA
jgi:DNA-binding NtrC family response regulator